MEHKQTMMLACAALRREVTAIMEESGISYPVFYVPDELHMTPEKLGAYLSDFIPRLVGVDYLLLPMGRCGNGTLGVPSGNTTIVLPKCDDCISLLLSNENLSDVERPKYNYFFTDGWLDYTHSLIKEHAHSIEKYGAKRAESIIRSMYKHYEYFTYIDTGYGDFKDAATRIEPIAKLAEVEVTSMKGRFGTLRKLVTLNFDDDFILIPPGEKIRFDVGDNQ